MALSGICEKGHQYIIPDILKGHPPGAPICLECFKEWLKTEEGQAWSNPPTLGIGISEGVATKDQLR